MKTKDLIKLSEEVDDVFHNYGYVLDHHGLTIALWNIIKARYPQEELKYSFESTFRFSGRGELML